MIERAVCYLRVSDDSQEDSSPQTMYDSVMEYVESKTWQNFNKRLKDVEIEFDDHAVATIECGEGHPDINAIGFFNETETAWEPGKRTDFFDMIEHVKRNYNRRNLKHMFFPWTTRFARNTEEWGLVQNWFRKASLTDIYIHIIKEKLVFNPFDKRDWNQVENFENSLVKGKAESGEKAERVSDSTLTKFKKGELNYWPGWMFHLYSLQKSKQVTEYVKTLSPNVVYIEGNQKYHFTVYYEDRINQALYIFKEAQRLKMSPSELANEFDRRKYRRVDGERLDKRFLHDLLTNIHLIGYQKHHGKITKSRQLKEVIPKKLFNEVQEIISSRERPIEMHNQGTFTSPFTRELNLVCGYCGCNIVSNPAVKRNEDKSIKNIRLYIKCSSGKRKKDPGYYLRKYNKKYCTLPFFRIKTFKPTGKVIDPKKETNMEWEILEAEGDPIRSINAEANKLWAYMDDYMLTWFEEEIRNYFRENDDFVETLIAQKNQEKLALVKKIENVKKGFEGGLYDDIEEAKKRKSQYIKSQTEIEAEIEELKRKDTHVEDEILLGLKLLQDIGNKWITMEDQEKAEILSILTEKIVITQKKPKITWAWPWNVFFKLGKSFRLGKEYPWPDSNRRHTD